MAEFGERLLKTDITNLKLQALSENKFRLTALWLDKEVTILGHQVLEVRAVGKQLIVRRRRRSYDPVEENAYETYERILREAVHPSFEDDLGV